MQKQIFWGLIYFSTIIDASDLFNKNVNQLSDTKTFAIFDTDLTQKELAFLNNMNINKSGGSNPFRRNQCNISDFQKCWQRVGNSEENATIAGLIVNQACEKATSNHKEYNATLVLENEHADPYIHIDSAYKACSSYPHPHFKMPERDQRLQHRLIINLTGPGTELIEMPLEERKNFIQCHCKELKKTIDEQMSEKFKIINLIPKFRNTPQNVSTTYQLQPGQAALTFPGHVMATIHSAPKTTEKRALLIVDLFEDLHDDTTIKTIN